MRRVSLVLAAAIWAGGCGSSREPAAEGGGYLGIDRIEVLVKGME
jgi:uncharacterized protein YceK